MAKVKLTPYSNPIEIDDDGNHIHTLNSAEIVPYEEGENTEVLRPFASTVHVNEDGRE